VKPHASAPALRAARKSAGRHAEPVWGEEFCPAEAESDLEKEDGMPYPILRLEKRKGQHAAAMEKHHERSKEKYGSNPDIDRERSKQNYHLIRPSYQYRREIESRIQAAQCRVRKDSVKFIDVLIGATPDFINDLSDGERLEYFSRALRFVEDEVGKENIFTAVVHLDERTPHMHICFTPITKDKRLSARDYMGGRDKLIGWQDRFHACMNERWPVLERGKPAAETNRKHLPVQLFKQATRIDEQIKAVDQLISDVTVFNAGRKRDELAIALAKLLPAADRFKRQVETMQRQVKTLENDNDQLKINLAESLAANDEMFVTLKSLEQRNRQVEKLLRRIPKEVLEEAKARPIKARSR